MSTMKNRNISEIAIAKAHREYNRILAQLDKQAKQDRCKGDICYGWDWPTLRIVKPAKYNRLKELCAIIQRGFQELRTAWGQPNLRILPVKGETAIWPWPF